MSTTCDAALAKKCYALFQELAINAEYEQKIDVVLKEQIV